jgi:hypothetical protein
VDPAAFEPCAQAPAVAMIIRKQTAMRVDSLEVRDIAFPSFVPSFGRFRIFVVITGTFPAMIPPAPRFFKSELAPREAIALK